ncbi:MAG: DegV family protein [Clostridia bacterium]|nr:DegV family protein [Clostridia bacterium]
MVKLIIDSPACASKQFVEENNITVVHLSSMLDGVTRQEGFEEDWLEFFEAVKTSSDFPKTSLPSPEQFLEAFATANDGDDILVITISKSLSGTFNAANVAREMYAHPEKVFVVDSNQCCQSELLLVEECVELIKQGLTGKEVYEKALEIATKTRIEFVPTTMEYLRRGGRISLLSATFASVLNIKPILSFKNGVLTCAKKCLGIGKALNEMVKNIPTNLKKIYVCYIHESEVLQHLIDKVNAALKTNIMEAKKIGPVVGSHIGIGAVGLATLENYS